MSVSERTIKAFIQVIENQPSLFSSEDRKDVHQLVGNLLEDSEEISKEIRKWIDLEGRDQIREAFDAQRQKIPSSFTFSEQDLGIGGSKSPTPPNQLSPNSMELLKNAIKINLPLSNKHTISNKKL